MHAGRAARGGEYLRASMPVKLEREALLELERELGAPMFVGSTSQSLAYAEKKQLEREGQRANELIYLNVGDGVGAGVICGDEIFSGGEGLAGEIGHATINYLGRPCGLRRARLSGAICEHEGRDRARGTDRHAAPGGDIPSHARGIPGVRS